MTESVWTRVIPAARPPLWQGQLFALAVVMAAFVARWAITPMTGPGESPFLTFVPAVLVATVIAGRWAGVTAIVAGGTAATWGFLPPYMEFALGRSGLWQLATFAVSSGVVWLTAALLRASVLKFREKKAQLEIEAAERERATQQLRTIAAELEHRVRNLLALIQGLVLQTGRGADSVEAYQKALAQRLQALAKAQTLVADIGSSTVPLPRILGDAVGPFAASEERLRLDGPDVQVAADLALPLALALHELSTNAVKYGALSHERGRIELSWTCSGDEVALVWKERDGPPVKAPERRGFGSRLLESALSAHRGRSEIAFEPDGVRYLATFSAAPA